MRDVITIADSVVGGYPFITIGADDLLVIVYYDTANNVLKVIRLGGVLLS